MNGATRPIDAGALNTSLGELAATVQKYINITLGVSRYLSNSNFNCWSYSIDLKLLKLIVMNKEQMN